MKSRLYTNEYGETTETSKVQIGFADKKDERCVYEFYRTKSFKIVMLLKCSNCELGALEIKQ